jgi:hypothetical protein
MVTKDDAALAEARRVADFTNALTRTMNSDDVVALARGLVCAAAAMAGDDPTTRAAVGMEMIYTALELDPSLADVRWQ